MNGEGASPKADPTTTDVDSLDPPSIALIAMTAREIGWDACMEAIFEAGQDLAREAAATSWRHPRFIEMEARRKPDYQPCSSRCGKCSRCICSLAYWRRGGTPFAGLT